MNLYLIFVGISVVINFIFCVAVLKFHMFTEVIDKEDNSFADISKVDDFNRYGINMSIGVGTIPHMILFVIILIIICLIPIINIIESLIVVLQLISSKKN